MDNDLKVTYNSPERAEARLYILNGWYQTSRRYRSLARLPEGETGISALDKVADWFKPPEKDDPFYSRREASAGDHYLRCYAMERVDVSRKVFEEYRKLGGGTYMQLKYNG